MDEGSHSSQIKELVGDVRSHTAEYQESQTLAVMEGDINKAEEHSKVSDTASP